MILFLLLLLVLLFVLLANAIRGQVLELERWAESLQNRLNQDHIRILLLENTVSGILRREIENVQSPVFHTETSDRLDDDDRAEVDRMEKGCSVRNRVRIGVDQETTKGGNGVPL